MLNKILAGIGGAALIASLSFYAGQHYSSLKCQAAQSKFQLQVEKLNNQLDKKQVQVKQVVKTQFITVTKPIQRVTVKNRTVIQQVLVPQLSLPKGFIYTHDQIAKGEQIDPLKANDINPSPYNQADLSKILNSNYQKYNICRQQVKGWNSWYEKNSVN